MFTLAYWLSICFFVMAGYQAIIGIWFSWLLLTKRSKISDQAIWPKAAILMSLRGADPQLSLSLQRILEQDYPHFKLHVVVDSQSDSAYQVVHQAAEMHGQQLDLSILTQRQSSCGLQCSAFVQAYQRVDEDAEVLITVDGDLMPHATWLKELVAPLLDPQVGATFGNRWFAPRVATMGSLARYLWNAAAVVPMALLSIPWGGCFAIRRSAFDQSRMIDKWSTAIVHDAPVMNCLAELKLKIRFVPGLMMPITEKCSLAFCLDFIKRQMTWTRLYHSGWSAIVMHAIVTTLLWCVSIGVLFISLLTSQSTAAAWIGGGLAGYMVAMLAVVSIIEACVRQTLIRRNQSYQRLGMAIVNIPLALLVTQCVHFVAVLQANTIRQVIWRGVTYHLRSPWDIELVTDRPFDPVGGDASL